MGEATQGMPHVSSTAAHAWICQGMFAEAQIFKLLLQKVSSFLQTWPGLGKELEQKEKAS